MTALLKIKRHLQRHPGIVSFGKGSALAAMVALSYGAAFGLRFDNAVPPAEWAKCVETLPFLVAFRTIAAWYWGLHRHWWRFVSLPDLGRTLKAIFAGSAMFGFFLLAVDSAIPRSILIIEPALSFLLIAGLMVLSRTLHPGRASMSTLGTGKRAIIVGAGETGNHAARELRHHSKLKYDVVGFVDDDPLKQGALIQGVTVLGTVADLPKLVVDYEVEKIVIAIPSAGHKRIREIVELCKGTGIAFGILPATTDLIQGRVQVHRIRQVRIEDLLGRRPVSFDLDAVRPHLAGSVICVTGAGGSIGSELCRQIASCGPALLLMIDRNENGLHYLATEIAQTFPGVALRPEVADITEPVRIEGLLAAHRPRMLFHAAAYKHVPLMEDSPCEAVRNNVGGTRHLAHLADQYGVERFVMISTDKAINPTSIMGATKRVAELLIHDLQRRSNTRFMTVRFGNVLGSEGSVVPLFQRQIERGGPVTLTDKRIVRYFMLVNEAVHLVLHASALGEGGEIFLLDMGEPIRIADLATDMIRLSGLEPGVDIEIQETGLRPGEKLYEELAAATEVALGTSHPKIMRLDQQQLADPEGFHAQLVALEHSARAADQLEVRARIASLVPEYRPPSHDPQPDSPTPRIPLPIGEPRLRKHAYRIPARSPQVVKQSG